MNLFKKKTGTTTATITDLFLANYSRKSRFAEAYRTLRTNVQFSSMEKGLEIILVTSAGQSEGKTSTVANLSYAMTQAGKRVLMIDADLRKPSLSRLKNTDSSPGLSGIIADVFGHAVVKGDIQEFSVSDLYRLLTFQKKTGILHLTDGTEKVDLIFLHGALKEIHWITRPTHLTLAKSLTENGLLKEEDIERAIVRHRAVGRKLTVTILSMGLLKEDEMETILNTYMMEGLRTALQFNKGEFIFDERNKADFEQASFDPVDLDLLYNQAISTGETLRFLKSGIDAAILKVGEEGLFLLPSGKIPHNPSELLGSERLTFLFGLLKRRFDLLVIDSPPILPASDALILAPRSDGVIFVIKAGMVNREMVKKATDSLKQANANMIGVALNGIDMTREGHYGNYYYHYYTKYYSKYYGEDS